MRNPIFDPLGPAVRAAIMRPLHRIPIHPALATLAEIERVARRFYPLPYVAGLTDLPEPQKAFIK